ncbi:MAG: hypothetical protein ACFFD2_16505, partial [Promethearchaeota archaeon]
QIRCLNMREDSEILTFDNIREVLQAGELNRLLLFTGRKIRAHRPLSALHPSAPSFAFSRLGAWKGLGAKRVPAVDRNGDVFRASGTQDGIYPRDPIIGGFSGTLQGGAM